MKQGMIRDWRWTGASFAGVAFGLLLVASTAGCSHTTFHTVTIPQLQTRYPVSASESYLDGDEVVFRPKYTLAKKFEFKRTLIAPIHDTTDTTLSLEPDLDRIVGELGGHAITNLRIEAVEYDPGSARRSAWLKNGGTGFAVTGGIFLGVAMLADEDSGTRKVFVPAGAVFAGLGALFWLLATTATTELARWHFRVSGEVVD